MKLPKRFMEWIYISNETKFGSEEYEKPYKIKGLFIPKGDRLIDGGGIMIQQNTDKIQFESNTKGVELITQNSKLWVKRVPNEELLGSDYTHNVTARSANTTGSFVTIDCQSTRENVPIL